ncbi:MAG TPA: gfo/Idh/MocA family oxidoreductase, partial [Verrucomicrobiae bacterium]|nr:gfo/Idh/MocA family oxidoreductase [Verrucomicrobiae bacterium]
MKKTILSRREFARRSAAAMAAVAFPNVIPASVLGAEGRPGANSRINVAMIGVGNQGTNDLRNFLNDERVQVVAVCDT